MLTDKELTDVIEYNAKKHLVFVQKRKDFKFQYDEKLENLTRLYKRFLFSNLKK